MSDVPPEKRKQTQAVNIGCLLLFVGLIVVLSFWLYGDDKQKDLKTQKKYEDSIADNISIAKIKTQETLGKDPYEIMNIAFEGFPDKEEIKPMLEAVMTRYNMPLTNENLLRVGNMLVVLRKDSKVGVTEMEILKHIYQQGSSSVSLADQAAISSVLLEKSK